jgi:hypothetical protein
MSYRARFYFFSIGISKAMAAATGKPEAYIGTHHMVETVRQFCCRRFILWVLAGEKC